MKKISLYLCFLLFFLPSYASVYKGQKEYMKKCRKCHGSGGKLAKLHTIDEWQELFTNNALLIKKLHQKDPKAMKYFNSKRFNKKAKHLLNFFKKYASDSGNIPACSD